MNSIKAIQAVSEVPSKLNRTETAVAANKLDLPKISGTSANYQPGSNIFETKEFDSNSTNLPTSHWYHILTGQGSDSNYNTQLALGMTNQAVFYRYRNASTWGNWKQLAFTDSSITGNASTATTLQTSRTINGTSFNGSTNITTANWGTTRTFTIGNTSKSVNGSSNVSWSLNEIGASSASHTHDYLPLSGGTVSGSITASSFYFGGAYAVKGDSSRIMRLQSGGTSPAAAGGWKTIVFPIAYTSIPRVVVSFEYDISLARPLNVRNITLTSFDVRVHDAGTGGTINWISYGY